MLRSFSRAVLGVSAALIAACSDGGDSPRMRLSTSAVAQAVSVYGPVAQTSFEVKVSNQPAELYLALETTTVAVGEVEFDSADGVTVVFIRFKSPADIGTGGFDDTVTVHVCRDPACEKEIRGSPADVAVKLYVTAGEPLDRVPEGPATAEAGIPPLPVTDQHLLGHDVVDAEYSEALDAIVLVSSYPSPKLYLYDAALGTAQSIALDQWPNAVSVGPDGLSAAVAHDDLVTVVDLANIDDPIVSPKTVLDVSVGAFDVVLAGNGYVYVFPREGFSFEPIRSIEIATNLENSGFGNNVFVPTRAKLHPSGDRIYGTADGLSSSEIERYDISGGMALVEYDSPYRGEYRMCGNLWFGEGAARIYTACGNLVRPSNVRAQDLLFAGSVDLVSSAQFSGSQINSLSHSAERDEVVLLEELEEACDSPLFFKPPCYTRLGVYGAGYTQLVARYSLAPVPVAGVAYRQRGMFVFHSADGTQRYLISRLWGVLDPAQGFLIGSVDVAGPQPAPPPEPVVQASVEAGIAAAPLTDMEALPYDVVDAEFSAALDAIVMVSAYPSNAVYVHDLATRTERTIPLTGFPTSVSVAPDGLHAAVGHDGSVTVVDLAVSGAAAPQVLDATIDVLDVVMAGNGYVYAFASGTAFERIRSLHIATNTETLSSVPSEVNVQARLHPSGAKMYGASGLSPDIKRYSIAGTAQFAYAWPNNGDFPTCINLWFSEAGASTYTACGHVLDSSDVQADDMAHAGALNLSAGHRIVWASESAETQQLALIEQHHNNCAPFIDGGIECPTHLTLYDGGAFTHSARYSLSPFLVAGKTYAQRGLFIFQTGDGSETFVLSRLYGMANPFAEFYISRLP